MTRVLSRPVPPAELCEPGRHFIGAPELRDFAEATLLDRSSPLWNSEHEHLLEDEDDGDAVEAGILYAWTNWPGKTKGRPNAGTCELLNLRERQWQKARGLSLALDWWDGEEDPTFLITIYAPDWAKADDTWALAVLDHELGHCGVALDEDGDPRYNSEGQPIWRLRPHDEELFVFEVERYGAYTEGLRRIERALKRGPTIAPATIGAVCGTCSRRIAA